MSELSEIRSKLDAIADSTSRTQQDVQWIKDGMERGTERMDKHDERIKKLEHRQHWYSGIAAAFGMIFGFGAGHFPKL